MKKLIALLLALTLTLSRRATRMLNCRPFSPSARSPC